MPLTFSLNPLNGIVLVFLCGATEKFFMICIWNQPCCLMLSKKETVGEFVRILPGTNYVDNDEWSSVEKAAKRFIEKRELEVFIVKVKNKDGVESERPAKLEELSDADRNAVIDKLASTLMADEMKSHTNKEGLIAQLERAKLHIEQKILEQIEAAKR